jgi:hypothetical protein
MAGKVLQVVSSFSDTATSSASTSEVDFLTTSITPSSTSSNISILANIGLVDTSADASNILFFLYRDSTMVGQGSGGTDDVTFSCEGGVGAWAATCTFLDSPSTASATEYKLKFSMTSGTGYLNQNASGAIHTSSSLILMEIGA